MTLQKTNLELPSEIRTKFESYNQAGDFDSRDDLIRALRAAKWTLASIAQGAALTRERVRQIALTPSALNLPDVPSPPSVVRKAPPVYIEPDPVVLARMLELQPLAQKVRSNSPNYRVEAEEYTRLLAEQHLDGGVTLYRMALRLGVTHLALRARLARYGYKVPPQGGSSRAYTPIDERNRVR